MNDSTLWVISQLEVDNPIDHKAVLKIIIQETRKEIDKRIKAGTWPKVKVISS